MCYKVWWLIQKSNRLFMKFLEAVLKTGNKMNVETICGGAKILKFMLCSSSLMLTAQMGRQLNSTLSCMQACPCHKAGEALAWGHILYSKNKVIFHIMFWTNDYLVWLYVIISLFHFYLIQYTSYANHIYYYFKPFCIVCGTIYRSYLT